MSALPLCWLRDTTKMDQLVFNLAPYFSEGLIPVTSCLARPLLPPRASPNCLWLCSAQRLSCGDGGCSAPGSSLSCGCGGVAGVRPGIRDLHGRPRRGYPRPPIVLLPRPTPVFPAAAATAAAAAAATASPAASLIWM